MQQMIDVIKKTREFLLRLTAELSTEQLNHIPNGFNNNIIWNLGHLIAAQQGVCYVRQGHPARTTEAFFEAYRPGSKPGQPVSSAEIATIKEMLFTTLDQFMEDYEAGLFNDYKPWTTRYGVELTNIGDAISFLQFHEGLHGGFITALKRVLEQQAA